MSDAASSTNWPPHCDICGEPLAEPGALLFSPPNEQSWCIKSHVCKPCHGWLAGVILHARTERARK